MLGCGDDAATPDGNSPDDMDGGAKVPLKPVLDAASVIDLLDARTRPKPGKDAGGDAQADDGCVPSEELCNDVDDDCDGETDEDFELGVACDGEDADECEDGETVCGDDGDVTCDDSHNDDPELCNGEDDDCDGEADEGFDLDTPCTEGVGACERTGQRRCNSAGTRAICDAVAGSPGTEVCGDGIDQDCSGADLVCVSNDLPANAIDISAGGNFSVDMTGTHDDDNYPDCGQTGGRDVFYTFTLAAPEVLFFDTFGSNNDTLLRIYSGACSGRSGEPLCADDADCFVATPETVLVTEFAAGTWCVVLDEYNGTQTNSNAKLNVKRGGRPGALLPFVSRSNEALTLSGNTCDGSDRSIAECLPNNSGAPDLAYYFWLCPDETVTFLANTCSNTTWDSVLYLTSPGSAANLACNDDDTGTCGAGSTQSAISKVVSGAGLRWLIVDGYVDSDNSTPDCGPFQLNYTFIY